MFRQWQVSRKSTNLFRSIQNLNLLKVFFANISKIQQSATTTITFKALSKIIMENL